MNTVIFYIASGLLLVAFIAALYRLGKMRNEYVELARKFDKVANKNYELTYSINNLRESQYKSIRNLLEPIIDTEVSLKIEGRVANILIDEENLNDTTVYIRDYSNQLVRVTVSCSYVEKLLSNIKEQNNEGTNNNPEVRS